MNEFTVICDGCLKEYETSDEASFKCHECRAAKLVKVQHDKE